MGLLLLPVFLYLLLSIPVRPVTKVPNEYKKSVLNYFPKGNDLFNRKISLLFVTNKNNQFICLEEMIWFDQLFDDKFSCYQMLVYSLDAIFDDAEIDNNQLSSKVLVVKYVKPELFSLMKQYISGDFFLLIDELGELRGVYLVDDEKARSQAKTEIFILLQNLEKCQKES